MFGNGTVPVLIITAIFIMANIVDGILLLSNKTTNSILYSAPIHSHHEENNIRLKNYEVRK